MTIICYNNDILIVYKLYEYILTLVAYYRCYKQASNTNKERFNFSSFDNMDD